MGLAQTGTVWWKPLLWGCQHRTPLQWPPLWITSKDPWTLVSPVRKPESLLGVPDRPTLGHILESKSCRQVRDWPLWPFYFLCLSPGTTHWGLQIGSGPGEQKASTSLGQIGSGPGEQKASVSLGQKVISLGKGVGRVCAIIRKHAYSRYVTRLPEHIRAHLVFVVMNLSGTSCSACVT